MRPKNLSTYSSLGPLAILLAFGCASQEQTPSKPEPVMYRCAMLHGEWTTTGRCPTCGDILYEASTYRTIFKCPKDDAVRSTPGACPKCGVSLSESNRVVSEKPMEGILYKCPADGELRSVTGPCPRCGRKLGVMDAVPEKPGGPLYRCPMQEGVRTTLGPCPHCGIPMLEGQRVIFKE